MSEIDGPKFDAEEWREKFCPNEFSKHKPLERALADKRQQMLRILHPHQCVRRIHPFFAMVVGMGISAIAIFLGFRVGQGHDYGECIFAVASFVVGAAYAFCQDE